MRPTLYEIDANRELTELRAFLCRYEWPFHGAPRLAADDVQRTDFALPTTRSFWIDVAGEHVGLLRLQDIDDIGDGSPVFDIRIAPAFRGRGIGRAAVSWLIAMVFREYPEAHRIEAATRIDNVSMRRVLEQCGFQLEGRLRESWRTADGGRTDTAMYGLLRTDVGRGTPSG